MEKNKGKIFSERSGSDQRVVYEKDSMDRLGDDLTEVILQYLTFKDKIRLECVSKQWQRCVYQRQFVIEITEDVNDKECHPEDQNTLNRLLQKKAINYGINRSVFKIPATIRLM